MVAGQPSAALRSLVELTPERLGDGDHVDLYLGPEQPDETDGRWLQTNPGKGWFVYFRIYGPEPPAFDGTWRLPRLRTHQLKHWAVRCPAISKSQVPGRGVTRRVFM